MYNGATELTLAPMAKDFLPYSIDQRLLLPPDMRDWLPEGHLARFVDELVDPLDLSAIDTVVDGEAQIIVAVDVVQAPNDKLQLTAMLQQVEQRVGTPAVTNADEGYYGEQVIKALERAGIELLVPPDRQAHGDPGLRDRLPRACVDDRLDALRASHDDRGGALPNALGDRGTGIRSDQKRARPAWLSSARACQCARRVSTDCLHTQHTEARIAAGPRKP
jgi:hypothetical protein